MIDKKIIYILILICISGACDNINRSEQESQAIKEAIKDREIRQIKDVDILNKAESLGREISNLAQATLMSTLSEKLQNKDFSEAIRHCNIIAHPLMDSMARVTHAEIRRVSFKNRNANNTPNELEAQLLEAYEYSHENQLEIKPSVQIEDDKQYVLYTKPIMISTNLCLNCHGEPSKEISEPNYDLLNELYPGDSATGYQLNDLRGMWSIRLPMKDVISRLKFD